MTLTAPPPPAARPPRPSATLLLVRDAQVGIEVLLLQRAERGDHNSGAWVFPGGIVDAGDRSAHACCAGLSDAAASARLGIAEGGLDYFVAAVRECFEEAGLLFATPPEAALARPEALAARRAALHRGELSLAALCAEFGLQLDMSRLAYFSHWLTPLGRAKRFDTRFFVAVVPEGQVAAADGSEVVAHRWFSPADALARAVSEGDGQAERADGLKLMGPTRASLAAIARFDSAAALFAWAQAQAEVPLIAPRIATGAHGQRPVLPSEPAWAEIGRLDPQGQGHVRCDIHPGVPVRLSERVIRVTAGNGTVMTGPGTNSYLVREGASDAGSWAVIDPGPLDAAHVAALMAAAPGPIRRIFATHTHTDHSPAVALLRERTGAAVYGRVAAHPEWQDATFCPDHPLAGGERFELGGPGPAGSTLRVIHTPGHASNHLCFLLEEERTLFTGDHVMQASTVVINPPDGDMAAYIASLRGLLAFDLEWLAPGHGFLMAQPRRAIEWIIAHRAKREAKVADALRELGPAPAEVLLAQVYDDVNPRLHGVALRSLKAHLLKLAHDGLAHEDAGVWASRV